MTKDTGQVYLWQGFSDKIHPETFGILRNLSIHQVALGSSHAAFLTWNGLLLMGGANSHGQLGVGGYESGSTPQLVETLKESFIVHVDCGHAHTAAVCNFGNVFCWGDSSHGQCGTGVKGNFDQPQLVLVSPTSPPSSAQVQNHMVPKTVLSPNDSMSYMVEPSVHTVQVSCGTHHTLALSARGELWTWGSGVAMGLGHVEESLIPSRVEYFVGRQVVTIVSGSYHCLVVVHKSNPSKAESSAAASVAGTGSQGAHTPSSAMDIMSPTTEDHVCPLGLELSHSMESLRTHSLPRNVRLGMKSHSWDERGMGAVMLESTGRPRVRLHYIGKQSNIRETSVAEVGNEMQTVGESGSPGSPSPMNGQLMYVQDYECSDEVEQMDTLCTEIPKLAPPPPGKRRQTSTSPYNKRNGTAELSITQDIGSLECETSFIDSVSSNNIHPIFSNELPQRSMSEPIKCETEDAVDRALTGSLQEQSFNSMNSGIQRSMSSFLDETEAKEFLQKQLYGGETPSKSPHNKKGERHSIGSLPGSPLVKRMENILQLMPTPPQAMQDYVSNMARSMVTSVRTSIDRFGLVYGQSQSEEGEGLSSSINALCSEDTLFHTGRYRELLEVDESKLGFLRQGGMPKSLSMGSPMRKIKGQCHIRRGSLPSGAVDTGKENRWCMQQDVVIDTEVWTWGQGTCGQLGHGDVLDRRQPCLLQSLNDKRVVKVAAGAEHSLALTADSLVYSWGKNSHGQLGHADPITVSPQNIKVTNEAPVSDIAAGDNHSLLLADGAGFRPTVYYAGKQYSDHSECHTQHLIRLPSLSKLGWWSGVVSGGELSGGLVSQDTCGLISLLHEFAASERHFLQKLHLIRTLFLQPLLLNDQYHVFESTSAGTAFQLLVHAFSHISDRVAQNQLELMHVIQGRGDLTLVEILSPSERVIATFQHYCKCFADSVAMGSFALCVKATKPFFEQAQYEFPRVLEEGRLDRSQTAVHFKRILHLPHRRLKEYAKLISDLALKFPVHTKEHHRFHQVVQAWDTLRHLVNAENQLGENTKAFWDTANYKFVESLRAPKRRLLRDSKHCPIHLHTAGRFSTHVFWLFNDVFVHIQYSTHQVYPLSTIWLEAVPDNDHQILKHAITLTTPEDSITLTALTSSDKADWLWGFNQAINKLLSDQRHSSRPHITTGTLHKTFNRERFSSPATFSPPVDRHAAHTFTGGAFKGAKYTGMWRIGRMHGEGEMLWPDGRRYKGAFKEGQQDGHGVYSAEREEGRQEVNRGQWKAGKLNGYGIVNYGNGDVYHGYFVEGKRHGHGQLTHGKHTSESASVYNGEWAGDKRNGYGVCDDILRGQKYMGLWHDDYRHGSAVIVSIDGMYFEGTYSYNKVAGQGLMMTEDFSCYEGDFSNGPNLSGKGTLTLPNGDHIDGTFNGSFNDGIKVNGTFYKATEHITERKAFTHALGLVPKSFGRMAVLANKKWNEIFNMCLTKLAAVDIHNISTERAWDRIAALVNERKDRVCAASLIVPEELQRIPSCSTGSLNMDSYQKIHNYLAKAFDCEGHPLGELMKDLVDVFRATYEGVGHAHPRLLCHAVAEVKSYVSRIYPIIRALFPYLPDVDDTVEIYTDDHQSDKDSIDDKISCEVVTAAGLLYPLLLPRIHPPLFMLYALYNDKDDEMYWRRVSHWNRQSDNALMEYLGMDQKFRLVDRADQKNMSRIKDKSYIEAIDTLQRISTTFSPADKLHLLQQTFDEINKVVRVRLGQHHQWCMDDLFPVFQYVVVRSRIQRLGAEIHFIDDFIEKHLENGELGIMFTTLKACYYQIRTEKTIDGHYY